MKGLYKMTEYLVAFEFQGNSMTTKVFASSPDAAITMLLGEKAQAAEFVRIISVKEVKKSE